MMDAIVIDSGLFPELALRLACELGKCAYFSPWASPIADSEGHPVGSGLQDFGVTRVDRPFELIGTVNEPKTWVFPDLYMTEAQVLLRELGKRVWGSSRADIIKGDYAGIHKSRDQRMPGVLRTEKMDDIDSFIERFPTEPAPSFARLLQYYQGHARTLLQRAWSTLSPRLEDLRDKLGAHCDSTRLMLSEASKIVEPRLDVLIVDGIILYPLLIGYERKGAGIISKRIEALPDVLESPVLDVLESLSLEGDFLTDFFSAKVRVNEEGRGYLSQATCRMRRPGDGIHEQLCENLGAIMAGKADTPTYVQEYACQVVLASAVAEKHALHISFPEEIRDNVKLYNFYRDQVGQYWTLPRGIADVVSVVAIGDSMEKVKKQALELANEVKADCLGFDKNVFDLIEEDIEQGWRNGVEF
jgi:hypothetical protein